MRLVLQRANADCAICAVATFLELSYEDVYIAAAVVDERCRGKSGMTWERIAQIVQALGHRPRLNPEPLLEEESGLLAVRWKRGSKHYQRPFREHLVAIDRGWIADSADGTMLPADEYLARCKATARGLLEIL